MKACPSSLSEDAGGTETESAAHLASSEGQLAEKRRQHRAFVGARLLLVSLFLGLWLLLWPTGYGLPYGFMFVLVGETGALLIYLRLVAGVRQERTLDRLHYVLLTAELGFHTAIFYFLGGLSWLGAVAYIYALMYATVFLTWRQAVAFTVAVAVAFMTLVSLDGSGLIPHQWFLPQGPDRFRDPEFIVTTSLAFVGVLATVTFWMVFIGNEVRRERDEALKANASLVNAQDELRRLNDELERKVQERTRALLRRAEIDQLTGLRNRGAVTRRCQEMLLLAKRGKRPLAVVMADADGFKACNDEGGHQYGDWVLQALARGLKEGCRGSDIVGRMGGDEFLIVLPDTAEQGALHVCRRVAERLEERKAEHRRDGLPWPSLSFGVAIFPEHGSGLDELIRVADRAMYEAKASGGGCWKAGVSGATFVQGRPVREANVEG